MEGDIGAEDVDGPEGEDPLVMLWDGLWMKGEKVLARSLVAIGEEGENGGENY